MTHTEKFDAQLSGLVSKERQKDYGHPADHFSLSSALKAEIRKHYKGDPRLLHALDMIADKMARLCNTPEHFDSWLDIAGYARTAVMVMDRKEETDDKRTEAYKNQYDELAHNLDKIQEKLHDDRLAIGDGPTGTGIRKRPR